MQNAKNAGAYQQIFDDALTGKISNATDFSAKIMNHEVEGVRALDLSLRIRPPLLTTRKCTLITTVAKNRTQALILLVPALYWGSAGTGCQGRTKSVTNMLVEQLDNHTIRYATSRPEGSPFISIGREIKILEPVVDLPALSKEADKSVPALIQCLNDTNKDWAANLVLYALTGRDALLLNGFENDIAGWRSRQKKTDRRHWTSWWAKTHGKPAWDGAHPSD